MTVRGWLACLLLFPSVIEAQPTEPSRAVPTSVRKVFRDCALTVWGCANRAGHSNDSEYEQIIQRARSQLGFSHTAPGVDLSKTVTELLDAVFLAQSAVPGFERQIWFSPVLGQSEPWRFITSAFAHGSLMHIAFNMYALWVMGTYLEPMLGRARFLAIYLLSAFGGSVFYLLLAAPQTYEEAVAFGPGMWWTPAVGASGAVFGLFGAFLVLQRRLGRSAAGMYVVIGINAVIGFVLPNIAWQAHLGGALTGAAAAAAIAYLGRNRGPLKPVDRRVHWAALGGLFVLLVVLSLVKYATA